MVSSFPARKYKNLRQIDPGLVFLKKQYLTKERLLDEVEKKFPETKTTRRTTFRLPKVAAPDAKSVSIVGDFNNWDIHANPMKKQENEDYVISLDLEQGREYQFRYLIDESKWENDWKADKYVRNSYGDSDNSVVVIESLN
jgi:1,4-alpha-glucan branching enzyme